MHVSMIEPHLFVSFTESRCNGGFISAIDRSTGKCRLTCMMTCGIHALHKQNAGRGIRSESDQHRSGTTRAAGTQRKLNY